MKIKNRAEAAESSSRISEKAVQKEERENENVLKLQLPTETFHQINGSCTKERRTGLRTTRIEQTFSDGHSPAWSSLSVAVVILKTES